MRKNLAATTLFLAALALLAPPLFAKHPAIARAERAIASGNVDPARDLAPLLTALERARDVDEKRELVGAISDLAESDGSSPNSVKLYLVENAPPVLLEVARTGANPFLQGDAISALRGMNVPRSVLEQAASIAEADPDSFVQSRGEILRNFIRSLPTEEAKGATVAVDPEKRRKAIAYLDQREIMVSTSALRDAAMRADPDAVKALLEAGIAPDTGAVDGAETPLYLATANACHSQGAETDWLVDTVRLLLEAGADVSRTDGNRNTPLFQAAHYCGPRIVTLLIDAGARTDLPNGSGVKPLALALIMSNFDAADAMVARGARLGKEEAIMVSGVTDPRGKAIIQKAMRGAGKP
ncbi:MAG: ankyrin repeat domain-containing protein [Thermoanaerobaculia bacterium]